VELLISDAPSEERDAVGWLHGFPGGLRRVGASMPGGFERYARILHPGRVGARPATWTEIASWSERRLDPNSDSKQLMVRDDGACWDEQPDHTAPQEGTAGLGEAGLRRLYEILAATTDTPDRLWLLICVVEYNWPRTTVGYTLGTAQTTPSPQRDEREQLRRSRELEARCGVRVAGERFILHRGAFAPGGGRWMQFPSYWWPSDRSWLVSTHIEATSTRTYVAGDDGLIERLRHDDVLEVVDTQLDHSFDGSR